MITEIHCNLQILRYDEQNQGQPVDMKMNFTNAQHHVCLKQSGTIKQSKKNTSEPLIKANG